MFKILVDFIFLDHGKANVKCWKKKEVQGEIN